MATSDLLFPIFRFPHNVRKLFANSWLISGSFGQALYKLLFFLPAVSGAVSIQSMVLIAVDRFGAVLFPLRSPLISLEPSFFLILVSWIIAMAGIAPFVLEPKLF